MDLPDATKPFCREEAEPLPARCAECHHLHRPARGRFGPTEPCMHADRPGKARIVSVGAPPDEACPLRHGAVSSSYADNRAFMFGVAYSRLRCREDAEDAVQDAAVMMLRQRSYPNDRRALAYTMVDYAARALMQRERYRRHERLDVAVLDRQRTAPSAEREALAAVELQELAERAPRAVQLVGMGYTLREISEITGAKPKALASVVSRWRRRNGG